MSKFEFVIPVSKEDLLKKTNVKDYVVEEVYSERRLPFQLKDAESKFKTNKHEVILTHFDTFYSVIEHFQNVESDVTTGGWKLILKVMTSLTTDLLDFLDRDRIGAEEKAQYLNEVKMTCYVLSQFVDKYEYEAHTSAARHNTSKLTKKKGPSKSVVDIWDSEKEAGVKAILQLFQLKVERLYDPPIMEEELISIVTGMCYKILETCHLAKSKATRDSIFHILGIMVKRHGHSFSCVVKLLQLLQQNEQLVVPISQGVAMISEKYQIKSLVAEIMREIGRIDTKELSKDSTCTKCFSSFLVELSKTVPEDVLPSINDVIHLLDEESYTMRNAILSVFGELVVRLMNKEDMDEALKATKEQFITHLQEHMHDVNAFVRSKVLQIWQSFIEEKVTLVSNFSTILPLVNERIQDKSSNVRKHAVQTIIKFIKFNDDTLKLTAEGLQKNLSKELEKLRQLELEKQKRNGEDDGGDVPEMDDDVGEEDKENSKSTKAIDNHYANEDNEQLDAKYKNLKSITDYLKSSIAFIVESHRSISLISTKLGSKAPVDVTEAIEFLVTGYEAGMKECIVGVRMMLPLIFSKDKEVKDAVVEAYKGIYLESKGGKMGPMPMATSLITLANTAKTLGEKDALRELVQEFVKSDLISDEVNKILWQKFTFRIPGTTQQESMVALQLIGFIASEQVEMLEANMNVIRDALENQEDYSIVLETCLVLMKLSAKKNPKDNSLFVLPRDHEIFEILTEIITSGITKLDRPNFVPMVERAISLIYKLAEKPDAICTDIIIKQIEIINKCAIVEEEADITMTEVDASGTPPHDFIEEILKLGSQSQKHKRVSSPSETLLRFLSTCGHVALQQLIYLDVVVFAEMKRQRNSANRDKPRFGAVSVHSASASGSSRTKRDERTIEDDLGLVGNVIEDAEAELIKKVIEYEIVTGGENLLSMLEPIIVTICSNQVKFSDPSLSAVSALALAKFMSLSAEYCETHLRLLFTILEKSSHPIVRSNTIICLGDLASRFPNQLEPWTANIYNKLRDDSLDVRLNTLQVLMQLILNDMIKVKGQISEIALCVLDNDPSISYTARLFFQEFAKKSNSIYNVLPDIVSRLSDPDSLVAEEQFQPIMKFLMSFIDKEKQSESLCEKLCHRMRATVEERQWRDLAYCLSLLPANERSIKKLNENFICFADKLQDKYVLECMQTVVSNAKKFAKPDAKTFIEEFSERLINHNNKKKAGDDDDEAGISDDDDIVRSLIGSSGKRTKSQTTAKKSKAVPKKAMRSLRYDDDDDDDDECAVEGQQSTRKTGHKGQKGNSTLRKRPVRGSVKKTDLVFSSSDDLDFNE